MTSRDGAERPKKSWREMDAGRNRSKHVSSPAARAESPKALASSASARAALDRAFNDGLIGKLIAQREQTAAERVSAGPMEPNGAPMVDIVEATGNGAASPVAAPRRVSSPTVGGDQRRPELMKKIRICEARSEVNALIDELLALPSELPSDWEILTRALDHDKDEVIRASLSRMDSLLGREKPPRRASLLQRLIGLAADTADDEVRSLADGIRAKLG